VAVVTTTGFVTADFTVWTPLITVLFFLLFFTGGSAGSTAGGVKIVRHIIILKNSFLEFRRLIHPNAVVPVRLHNKAVNLNITFNVLAFFILYLGIFSVGTVVMAIILPDVSGLEGEGAMFHRFSTAVGASASCVGNVGPGFGGVGPLQNYAWIPAGGKLFLAFQMLVGRLELFTVLILFSPSFWRKN
jgi:trk system potassium uptake protein TrkH